jgi:transposase-like protein
MIERGGQVVIRMLANVQQATLHPIIEKTVAKGSNVYTDEYSIYARLPGLGYRHKTVCLAHDEVRDFFRPATRRKEHVPAARQRAIHVQRVAALRDMLAVA